MKLTYPWDALSVRLSGVIGYILFPLIILVFQLPPTDSRAEEIGFYSPGFSNVWRRVDQPIQDGASTNRGYTWGPPIKGYERLNLEYYNGTTRSVQYFDKARMEVNNPAGDPTNPYFVTTGLLVKELVTGQRQDSDSSFSQLAASTVQVAGDSNEGGANVNAPTYASFRAVCTCGGDENKKTAALGTLITSRIDRSGNLTPFEPAEKRKLKEYVKETGHNIADVFIDFAYQEGLIRLGAVNATGGVFAPNWVYVLGFPLTEPYWTRTVVAGVEREVLVQLFERRAVTYTPSNPDPYKVEMGNVGQHYARWRYELNGVNPARFDLLSKGVNLSHWFAQDNLTAERLRDFNGDKDFQFLASIGLRHVRLPLDPKLLFDENQPAKLNEANLGLLDTALGKLRAAKLAIILDLHPEDGTNFKPRLTFDDGFVDKVAIFWETLARHLSNRYGPEILFLEDLNEPAFHLYYDNKLDYNARLSEGAGRWAVVQPKLLAAMRRGAPNHILIANAPNYMDTASLKALAIVADANVVYNIHFYEPFTFTHQGATWTVEKAKVWRDLPYPASPEACRPALQAISDPTARADAEKYCSTEGNRAWLENKIGELRKWGQARGVRLIVNEFGVLRYRKDAKGQISYLTAPPDSRNRWLKDVRSLLESSNVGWTMWDYSQDFGLVAADRTPDWATVEALGLKPKT